MLPVSGFSRLWQLRQASCSPVFFAGPGGRPAGRATILVKITAEDGTIGWGQSVPSQLWSYETPELPRTTIDRDLGSNLDLDRAYSALLEETLVVVNSKMGRKPRIGDPCSGGVSGKGCDHRTHGMSVPLAGAGRAFLRRAASAGKQEMDTGSKTSRRKFLRTTGASSVHPGRKGPASVSWSGMESEDPKPSWRYGQS